MKRLFALALALLLLAACLPAAAAFAPKRASSWEAIEAIEARAAAGVELQNEAARTAAYADSVDDMIRAVRSAGDYVPGSLERHGDFFFWLTDDGTVNGYSPSLRARIQAGSAAAQPVSAAETPASVPVRDPENTSDNRNVAVFIPYSDSYYFHAEDTVAQGAAAANSTCGELTVYLQADANVNNLAQAIADSGFLLINSHGVTDYESGTDHTSRANSSYICLPSKEGITSVDQRPVSGPYGTYYHYFYNGRNGDEEYYCVDGTCISNHMQGTAPHSMVWLGCCLGMATEGLYGPLREKGVEALIGFSQPVTVDADEGYRGAFCQAMTEGKTVGEAAAIMKEKIGCPDPFQTAHAPAWPIAVSDQDPYPGRDHVDEAQEVRSTWELYPAYPIQVTLEPADGGVVTVTRTVLTVQPNPGFTFSDWEITAGEATATQKGSVLSFTLAEPCAVTIRFSPRTPATVEFSAGPGQEAETIHGYIDDVVTLPEPSGQLDADAYVYHFVGWAEAPLEADTPERPALLAAGSKLKLTETSKALTAVYGYFAPEDDACLGQFRRVDEAPEDWAGDYVLSYQSEKVLRAETYFTGHSIAATAAVTTPSAAGCFLDGDWFNEVPDSIVYELSCRSDGACLLKMKGSENYLAVTSSSESLTTTDSPSTAGARWRLSWGDNGVIIKNARFTSKILQYSPTASCFCTLTTQRAPLTLYVREAGEHLYTCAPKNREPEPPEEFRFDDVQDPNAYYFTPVYWAYSHEPRIASGVTATTFGPSAPCTRAQIVTFLWHAVKDPEPGETDSPFSDVQKPAAYYYKPVLWAYENGITSGVSPTEFGVGRPCTRAQVMTFLWTLAGKPVPEEAENPFVDVKPTAYYYQAVLWAYYSGITTGTGPTAFSPNKTCTRAQCVTFLYQYLARDEE